MGAQGDDELCPLVVGQQHRDVFGRSGAREDDVVHPELVHALASGGASVSVSVDDDLRSAGEGLVRNGVHVADDHVELVPLFEYRVGSAVHPDHDGPVFANVGAEGREVLLVSVASDDDEDVAPLEGGFDVGHSDAVENEVLLALDVLHRVRGEGFELDVHAGPRVLLVGGDRLRRLNGSGRDELLPCVHLAGLRHAHARAFADLHDVGPAVVDQRHPRRVEDSRSEVGVSPRRRFRRVDDDERVARHEGLGGNPVDVRMVDDRDLARPQTLRQILRARIHARLARMVIDQRGFLLPSEWECHGFIVPHPNRRRGVRQRGLEPHRCRFPRASAPILRAARHRRRSQRRFLPLIRPLL